MNWIGNRISFIDSKGKTTIVISPEKNYLITALMGAWLAMWITIGCTVFLVAFLSSIIKSRRNNYLHIFSFLGLLYCKSFKVFSVVALWQRINQD